MGRVKVTLYRASALPSASYSPTFREMDFLEKPKVRAHEKYRCSRDVPPSSDSAMVKVTLYRDRNRTGESAATTSAEGAVLPLFTRITAYESYIYRLLSPKESRLCCSAADRGLSHDATSRRRRGAQVGGGCLGKRSRWRRGRCLLSCPSVEVDRVFSSELLFHPTWAHFYSLWADYSVGQCLPSLARVVSSGLWSCMDRSRTDGALHRLIRLDPQAGGHSSHGLVGVHHSYLDVAQQ